ncbi:membrane protein insertion efficiency factor YidD [Anaerosphaera multitolerans]|uniref:Putative membrane protein insertion efficiency factor n=1 Tax=Anaerosphaera multitolerans TaxID=2487351 RepID=A0A437S9E2_9FIRM|nr:membrane protein insertion efficiency factor YidD [Anaerosphaera multitolerans]RVU55746.1 membrane protein insertion efficiency factor YidD [Anaerosphaera multitolerans]
MRKIVLLLIRFYQKVISKYILTGAHCRFYPTCSQYAYLAFEKYGFFKASYLSIKRILRCNPFFKGGYDPLP